MKINLKHIRKTVLSFLLAGACILGQGNLPAQAQLQPGLSDLSRTAAAEGIIMLKNEDEVLPLGKNGVEEVSVFGRIQVDYFACGYGSGGDVKFPYTVNLLEGLRENPAIRVNEELASVYENWCAGNAPDHGSWGKWPLSHPEMPLTKELVADAGEHSDTAVVVIGRSAGEDRDAKLAEGSWYLTASEKDMLSKVNEHFENVVVLLNIGTLIDMAWMQEYDNLDSILIVWQGGMESGHAVADVLTGDVTPSGKLTQTIAKAYEYYPSSENNGRTDYNNYAEDIYVGYRYFETFAKEKVQYPFGYGLSYTEFEMDTKEVAVSGEEIAVTVAVTNVGDTYSGKEVVQVYYGAPQGVLGKAEKSLIAYCKTHELRPGATQEIRLTFSASDMASFDDAGKTGRDSAFVLEAGDYPIYVGNSVRDAKQVGNYRVENLQVVEQLSEANAVEHGFPRMVNENGTIAYEPVPTVTVDLHDRIEAELPEAVTTDVKETVRLTEVYEGNYTLDDFVAQLSFEELEALSRGDYTMRSSLGAAGNAAVFGGTTKSLREKGVATITTNDGPSGIRQAASASLVPIGTCLAGTWNDELIRELYALVGQEMVVNESDVLLAPGMNLQRDPLCGRNFEYFSEDPVLTGLMGANVVKGVQSQGVAACPKHFALNNQETGRNVADSRASERAQRELYLRGFEIMIKTAKPQTLMGSYNKINGEYSHYHYELFQTILRDEWGFEGVVMTDWWIAEGKPSYMENVSNNAYRVRAHVDVLMPGEGPAWKKDTTLEKSYNTWLKAGCPEGTVDAGITLGELQRTAKSVLNFVMKSEDFRTSNGYATYAEEYAGETTEFFTIDTEKAPEKPVLTELTIDGNTYPAFDSKKFSYRIFVRDLEERVPVTEAKSAEGEVSIVQATPENPSAKITVEKDGVINTYKIIFTNAVDLEPVGEDPVYAKVENIFIDGVALWEFYPTVKEYHIVLEHPLTEETEISAQTPEGVDSIVRYFEDHIIVRAESKDQATEYRIFFSVGEPPLREEKVLTIIGGDSEGDVTYLKETSSYYQSGNVWKEIGNDPAEPEGGDGMHYADVATGDSFLFDVQVEQAGYYLVAPRAAALDATGLIQYSYQLESDGEVLTGFMHSATGGWFSWVTQKAKPVYLKEGRQTLRLLFDCAAINVNYLEFTYLGAAADLPDVSGMVQYIFSDVYKDWYTGYVQYVYDNGLMTGIQYTTEFRPLGNVTKAQVAQVLYNMENRPVPKDGLVFTELQDVYAGEWYADAVAWAYNTGIITGDLNTKKFSPNTYVTREQLALMMYRYAQYKQYDTTQSGDFAGLLNANKVANWSEKAMRWAVGSSLISGIEQNGEKDLAPQGTASRAQLAAILQRFCTSESLCK